MKNYIPYAFAVIVGGVLIISAWSIPDEFVRHADRIGYLSFNGFMFYLGLAVFIASSLVLLTMLLITLVLRNTVHQQTSYSMDPTGESPA